MNQLRVRNVYHWNELKYSKEFTKSKKSESTSLDKVAKVWQFSRPIKIWERLKIRPGKAIGTRTLKCITFVCCVKCCNLRIIDYNRINTLYLVLAVTSDQTWIKSKVLGFTDCCDLRQNQIWKINASSMLQSTQFLHIFQKVVYSINARAVALMVSRQFKTIIPYLHHIQLIYSLCTMSNFSIGLLTKYFRCF